MIGGKSVRVENRTAVNLILLYAGDFIEGGSRVRLTGRRLEHVRSVHRARPGDRLRVGVRDGRLGHGTVTALEASLLEMDVILDEDPPPPLPLTLVLALPRPKVLGRVIQHLTALGVKRTWLINAWRVEKSYWQSPLLEPVRLEEHIALGLEQARDTRWPAIELRPLFRPFVEDELPAIAAGTRALVAHPPATERCPRAVAGPVTLAVGPEGGFIPFEVDLMQQQGFASVGLGARILRVETVLPYLVGRLF